MNKLNIDALNLAKNILSENISIADYYNDYVDANINLEQYNRDCCPIHDEDSPSFFFFEDSKRFHCFGCGASGHVTELHWHLKKREITDFSITKSVLELSKLYKVAIPNLFDEIPLETKIGESHKLKVKKKEDMLKPIKRVITSFELKLSRAKQKLAMSDYIDIIGDLDKALFLDADLETDIKKLDSKLSLALERTD